MQRCVAVATAMTAEPVLHDTGMLLASWEQGSPASMVECSSRRRELTSEFICCCLCGSSGKGYRLAPKASQICSITESGHQLVSAVADEALQRLMQGSTAVSAETSLLGTASGTVRDPVEQQLDNPKP